MMWYLLWPGYRLTGSTGRRARPRCAGHQRSVGRRHRGHGAPSRRHARCSSCTLLGCALLVRSLGGGFTASYWNPHVTTLPFALLVMLVWAHGVPATGGRSRSPRWRRPSWRRPTWGSCPWRSGCSAWGWSRSSWRPSPTDAPRAGGALGTERPTTAVTVTSGHPGPARPAGPRTLAAPALVTAGLLAVLWVPPVIDVLTNEPCNAGRTARLVPRCGRGRAHVRRGLADRVGAVRPRGRLGGRAQAEPLGLFRPPRTSTPPPFRCWGWSPWPPPSSSCGGGAPATGRALVVTLAVASVISVVAVARTIGPIFDYRLRWTLVAPMLVFVTVAWAGWLVAARRWPEPPGGSCCRAWSPRWSWSTASTPWPPAGSTRWRPGTPTSWGPWSPTCSTSSRAPASAPTTRCWSPTRRARPAGSPGGCSCSWTAGATTLAPCPSAATSWATGG